MNCTIEHTWNVKRLLEFIFESKSQRDIRHTGGLLGAWSLSPIICERPSATARPGSIFMIIFLGEISIYLLQTNSANGAWWGWTPVWAYNLYYKLDFKFHMLGSCKDSQLCLVSNFDDTQYLQGVPKKIVHSNFLAPGHDFLTGSSNFGSQHQFQNLQAKGVYLKAFSKNDKCLKTTKIGASASARK